MRRFVGFLVAMALLAGAVPTDVTAAPTILGPSVPAGQQKLAEKASPDLTQVALSDLDDMIADETTTKDHRARAINMVKVLRSKDEAAKVEVLKELYALAEVKTEIDLTVSPASEGCDLVADNRVGTNVFGWALWRFDHEVYYCWNGNLLTQVNSSAWGQTYSPTWFYFGVNQSNSYGGVGHSLFQETRGGKFQQCIFFKGVGCIAESNPVITLVGGAQP